MSEAILVALITGGLSLAGVLISSRRTTTQVTHRLETHQAVTDTKLEALTREVRLHNGFAQRMPVVEEQIRGLRHRLNDLEKEVQHP